MKEEVDILLLFKKWCKDTKRSGGVLVGGSIREFIDHIKENCITFKKDKDEHIKEESKPTSRLDFKNA